MTASRRTARCLAAVLCVALLTPGPGPRGSGPGFATSGTYVYMASGQELGRESFSSSPWTGGLVIRSHTQLDLETYILDQTSEMTVDHGGALVAISIRGNSGGKPFGLTARVIGSLLTLEDTVRGIATVVDYDEPLTWITGNFMQHLIHAFRLYNRGLGGRQVLATQAGDLTIDPLGAAFLDTGSGEVPVERFRLALAAGEVELCVQEGGGVPLITVPGQGVTVRRLDALAWRLLPEADPELRE